MCAAELVKLVSLLIRSLGPGPVGCLFMSKTLKSQVPPEAGVECAWMVIVRNSDWLRLPQALCARKG